VAAGALRSFLADEARFLTFRRPGPGLVEHRRAYLAFGFLLTWAAGVGRYWDNPRAEIWQATGLGSVAYVFVLALLLWAFLLPLRPERWTYGNVLLLVVLTAPPALIYVVPVEMFLSPADARTANAWFLAVVAAWRVALLLAFLLREGRLTPQAAVAGTLLPLCFLVVALAALNLEHVVVKFMAGFRTPEELSPGDDAYEVVVALSWLSCLALPFLLAWYAGLGYAKRWRPRGKRDGDAAGGNG
jgi:hypothetical protein